MAEEKPPIDHPEAAAAHAHESPVAVTAPKSTVPPAVILALLIIALLGFLVMITLRGDKGAASPDADELRVLKAQISAAEADINARRMAMGLRPREGLAEPVDEVATRLKKDADTMVALAGSFEAMLTGKDAELAAKSTELLRSEQLRQSLAAESARLQGELQRALVNGSQVDLLRPDLEALKSQRDALAAELNTVRQDLAAKAQGVSTDDFADLKRRFEETLRAKEFFEAKVKELEGEVSKSKLFASSENELLPAAVALFRNLRLLENRPEAELTAAYSGLAATLGANRLHTLNFATGSSGLNPADEESIRNLVAEIPDGDLVMAIGYASETGNLDKNQTLSSDRATAAAQLFVSVKRPGQVVQAVYLGQTDRFSSSVPERNQLVEIWRIRKK